MAALLFFMALGVLIFNSVKVYSARKNLKKMTYSPALYRSIESVTGGGQRVSGAMAWFYLITVTIFALIILLATAPSVLPLLSSIQTQPLK